MKNFRMMKHLALTAGLLALCGAPALRAQTQASSAEGQRPERLAAWIRPIRPRPTSAIRTRLVMRSAPRT